MNALPSSLSVSPGPEATNERKILSPTLPKDTLGPVVPTFDELVVFQEAHILPFALIHLKPKSVLIEEEERFMSLFESF